MPAIIPSDGTTLKIHDFPNFRPHYTPREILDLGAFKGGYFFRRRGLVDPNSEMFRFLSPNKFQANPELVAYNYFGVAAAPVARYMIPYHIISSYPGGFFTWYSIFYYGKGGVDQAPFFVDWWDATISKLYSYVDGDPGNLNLFKPYRQAMLELGWDSTKNPNI